jgi:hypothetical protein
MWVCGSTVYLIPAIIIVARLLSPDTSSHAALHRIPAANEKAKLAS